MRIRVLLFLILLFPISVFAQSKRDEDATVNAAEKLQIQSLAKRFVKLYIRERDIKPLTKEFFVRDFETLFGGEMVFGVGKVLGAKLNQNEKYRSYAAFASLLYLNNLVFIVEPNKISGDDLIQILPAKIVAQLDYKFLDGKIDDSVSKDEYLKNLKRWEIAFKKAVVILKKKNIEGSSKYRKRMKELMTRDVYQYPVSSLTGAFDGEDAPAEFIKRFPKGTRIYNVGTPIGLALILVKLPNGKFKAVMVGPHPWD